MDFFNQKSSSSSANWYDQLLEMLKVYGINLLIALVILVIGWWLINRVVKLINGQLDKRSIDPSLKPFFKSLMLITFRLLLAISVLSTLGIEMTSFIAILGAAGLAVGMALSGTLQNFAGGVIILLFKPFKVGDVIEAMGYIGSVKEIQIFVTILTTPDNKTILIPNGSLSNSSLINYSTEPTRRVDMTFGIGYNDDIDKARKILTALIVADERILKEPAPFVAVSELADSSVNFALRVWCNSGDYWGIFFDMQENVKKTFDKESISIPFPQRDIHVFNAKK